VIEKTSISPHLRDFFYRFVEKAENSGKTNFCFFFFSDSRIWNIKFVEFHCLRLETPLEFNDSFLQNGKKCTFQSGKWSEQ